MTRNVASLLNAAAMIGCLVFSLCDNLVVTAVSRGLSWSLDKNLMTIWKQICGIPTIFQVAWINLHFNRKSVVQFSIFLLPCEVKNVQLTIALWTLNVNIDVDLW